MWHNRKRSTKSKKGFLQNINIQYSSKADNRAIFADDLLLKKGMFENAKSGVQHNIPFTTNFKMFKHFSVSVGGQYQETWTGKTINYSDYNEELGAVIQVLEKDVNYIQKYLQKLVLG